MDIHTLPKLLTFNPLIPQAIDAHTDLLPPFPWGEPGEERNKGLKAHKAPDRNGKN